MTQLHLPDHYHKDTSGNFVKISNTYINTQTIKYPLTAEDYLEKLHHLPMFCIPILGLVYAAILCKQAHASKQLMRETYNLDITRCTNKACTSLAFYIQLPIVIAIIGGLGFMIPVLAALLPALLIYGLIQTILSLASAIRHCIC
ncbi:hypothetical protein CP10139811_0334 [Chlamydia ibidis]|uniref:Uncharacterized protein n=2 Tax=Chlamydia ibidis TaxID=1405396 RepID=S7KIY2_9CHLA|nr:hypothetical protein [Chlamydia ibidis]EPP34375.1 hypothetical protein CP10139811_0334 [Chlamydia ibidis]EQM63142.1 hypothetical protein H359_0421 [Chlamydia ibidis 10-1398/6]